MSFHRFITAAYVNDYFLNFQGYMIWKPNLIPDEEKLKAYSAPSLLRQYNENKWRTTTQTTYQNYFLNNRNSNAKIEQQLRNSTGMSQRTVGTESHSRMKTRQNSKQQTRQENKGKEFFVLNPESIPGL